MPLLPNTFFKCFIAATLLFGKPTYAAAKIDTHFHSSIVQINLNHNHVLKTALPAVFVNGQWYQAEGNAMGKLKSYAKAKTLQLVSAVNVTGYDEQLKAHYIGIKYDWEAGSIPFETTVLRLAAEDTRGARQVVAFRYNFPAGANGTCTSKVCGGDIGDKDSVMVHWASFQLQTAGHIHSQSQLRKQQSEHEQQEEQQQQQQQQQHLQQHNFKQQQQQPQVHGQEQHKQRQNGHQHEQQQVHEDQFLQQPQMHHSNLQQHHNSRYSKPQYEQQQQKLQHVNQLRKPGIIHDNGELFVNNTSLKDVQQADTSLDGRLSWQGSFVQGVNAKTCQWGRQGGPCVLFNLDNPAEQSTAILASVDQFLTTSRTSKYIDGSELLWSGATSGSVVAAPARYNHTVVVYEPQTVGITGGLFAWGTWMQHIYNSNKIDDVTIEALGYQTDNGAQYTFGCRKDCDQALLKEKNVLEQDGITLGYLSFQNPWFHSNGKAPWCISDWDWKPEMVPLGVPEFQRRLGLPLQLYAPYFCPDSKYTKMDFEFLSSNVSLPGCSAYDFRDVVPEDSYAFYTWLFAKGKTYGMVAFEPDFLNQNINCVSRFIQEPNAAAAFFDGMNHAAMDGNIPIQWCYATPSALLQTLNYDSVTNLRGSFDYYYGSSWDIGVSSMLIWALGAVPSKDTFWTTDNGEDATTMGGCDHKGCPPDHSNAAGELHTLLALLSRGPVGFGDAVGHTDTNLLRRTCRSATDPTLLRPSKPITAIDATFAISEDLRPDGYVLSTYAGPITSSNRSSKGHASFESNDESNIQDPWSYLLLWHQMGAKPYDVKWSAFWPTPSSASRWLLRSWHCDVLDSNGTNCLSLVTVDQLDDDRSTAAFTLIDRELRVTKTHKGNMAENLLKQQEQEQQEDVLPIQDKFTPHLAVLTYVCDSNIAVLGQVDKYVSTSEDRFASIRCRSYGADVVLYGTAGEHIEVVVVEVKEPVLFGASNAAFGVSGDFDVRVSVVAIGEDGVGKAEFCSLQKMVVGSSKTGEFE